MLYVKTIKLYTLLNIRDLVPPTIVIWVWINLLILGKIIKANPALWLFGFHSINTASLIRGGTFQEKIELPFFFKQILLGLYIGIMVLPFILLKNVILCLHGDREKIVRFLNIWLFSVDSDNYREIHTHFVRQLEIILWMD